MSSTLAGSYAAAMMARAKPAQVVSGTPAIAQRRKWACAPVHLPNSGGRSRQGAAVRASHSTASTKSRLSEPLRMGNPSRLGRCPSIRAHCASVNVRLLKIASVFDLESELTSHGDPLNADSAAGANSSGCSQPRSGATLSSAPIFRSRSGRK